MYADLGFRCPHMPEDTFNLERPIYGRWDQCIHLKYKINVALKPVQKA